MNIFESLKSTSWPLNKIRKPAKYIFWKSDVLVIAIDVFNALFLFDSTLQYYWETFDGNGFRESNRHLDSSKLDKWQSKYLF